MGTASTNDVRNLTCMGKNLTYYLLPTTLGACPWTRVLGIVVSCNGFFPWCLCLVSLPCAVVMFSCTVSCLVSCSVAFLVVWSLSWVFLFHPGLLSPFHHQRELSSSHLKPGFGVFSCVLVSPGPDFRTYMRANIPVDSPCIFVLQHPLPLCCWGSLLG